MAPPILIRKRNSGTGNPKPRKRPPKAQKGVVAAPRGRELTKAEYDYYRENAPDVLRRALADGTWIAPGGNPPERRPATPATTPPAGATPATPPPAPKPATPTESPRDRERAQERLRARQSLNEILKNNPELTSSDFVMLPDGRVIRRPVPDVSLNQARERVTVQMSGGAPATEYERALAFGDIMTRKAQEDEQKDLQNFYVEALARSGSSSLPSVSQNVLRRAAGSMASGGANVTIKSSAPATGTTPPTGAKPATPTTPSTPSTPSTPTSPSTPSTPKPSGSGKTVYMGKYTDAQKSVIASAGTDGGTVGQARAAARGSISEFRQQLINRGVPASKVGDIVDAFSE